MTVPVAQLIVGADKRRDEASGQEFVMLAIGVGAGLFQVGIPLEWAEGFANEVSIAIKEAAAGPTTLPESKLLKP